jgi:hypothetical protein
MKFTADHQPKRRRGKSKDKLKRLIDESTQEEAKIQLSNAIREGQSWAVMAVLDRIAPKLKPATDPNSLDGQYIELKMKEISELEERIKKLEELAG